MASMTPSELRSASPFTSGGVENKNYPSLHCVPRKLGWMHVSLGSILCFQAIEGRTDQKGKIIFASAFLKSEKSFFRRGLTSRLIGQRRSTDDVSLSLSLSLSLCKNAFDGLSENRILEGFLNGVSQPLAISTS